MFAVFRQKGQDHQRNPDFGTFCWNLCPILDILHWCIYLEIIDCGKCRTSGNNSSVGAVGIIGGSGGRHDGWGIDGSGGEGGGSGGGIYRQQVLGCPHQCRVHWAR